MVNGDDPRLRRIAMLDAVLNNTDRKAGHLLPIPGGHLYAVDHGVTFSVEPKLRTRALGVGGRAVRCRGAWRGSRACGTGSASGAAGSLAGRPSPSSCPSRDRGHASARVDELLAPAASRARIRSGPRSPGRRI